MMFRCSAKDRKSSRRGFTLVELAIVLAVASVLFAGLWRLMSSGNTQLRDQSAADQHRQLISAVSGFLTTDQGREILTKMNGTVAGAGNRTAELLLPTGTNCDATAQPVLGVSTTSLCTYLPIGFSSTTTNSYGQTYKIILKKDASTGAGTAPKSYSFLVYTTGGDDIADTSGGRIASMIGNDGGFFYATNVCGAVNATACGAFGGWSAAVSDYDLSSSSNYPGHIVSRTYSGDNASLDTLWLARKDTTSLSSTMVPVVGGTAPDLNTIQTSIYMTQNAGIRGSHPTESNRYGGFIENVKTASFGRSVGTENQYSLRVMSGCDMTQESNRDLSSCPAIMFVSGNMSVNGLLQTTDLYAQKVVYKELSEDSDIRLKKDIQPMENILDRMAKLKGYEFTMKETEKRRYGLIAQEVEEVFPLAVHEMADGYKGMEYTMMVGPLVQAVNALRAENEKLRADMDALAAEVKALKAGKSAKKK